MDGVTAEYPVTLKQLIPERAGYVDMHLSFLCTFLPLASVALITTNRHAIRFICCLKPLSPNGNQQQIPPNDTHGMSRN